MHSMPKLKCDGGRLRCQIRMKMRIARQIHFRAKMEMHSARYSWPFLRQIHVQSRLEMQYGAVRLAIFAPIALTRQNGDAIGAPNAFRAKSKMRLGRHAHLETKMAMRMGAPHAFSGQNGNSLGAPNAFQPKWKFVRRGILGHFCAKCIFAPSENALGLYTWAFSRKCAFAPKWKCDWRIIFGHFRENVKICRRFRYHVTQGETRLRMTTAFGKRYALWWRFQVCG